MLVQRNRNDHGHRWDAAATDVPLPGFNPAPRTAAPVIGVLGRVDRVAGLRAHLPGGWSLCSRADLREAATDDIVVIGGATEGDVRAARDVLPRRTAVVAVVDVDAPPGAVAAVLTAGADVCVRGGQPAILAGHLVGCRRRQGAGYWPALDLDPAAVSTPAGAGE